MLLGFVIYGCATGVMSSRKLERATWDSVALRFIAANGHPDHDTIAAFRRRFMAPGNARRPAGPWPAQADPGGPVFGIIKSVMGFRQFHLQVPAGS